MTAAAIEVDALSMRYPKVPRLRDLALHPFRRDTVPALDGVTFAVPPGILFGFLGPNGAGKTSLIKILTTLILPTRGAARVGGFDVTREPEAVKRRIGVVLSDERSFYWRLTGRQNLAFFATLHGLRGARAEARIRKLLTLMDLADKADQRFSDYSSGQKQKLAIARGLLPEPEILFFDEPTRSLDPISARQIRTFIRERLVRGEGRTVFLTTHNLHEAEEISDRVGIINRGRLLAVGTVAEIGARLRRREPYTLRLGGPLGDIVAALAALPGVAQARRNDDPGEDPGARIELIVQGAAEAIPAAVSLCVARGLDVLECARREATLEDVFAEIVTEDAPHGDAR